MEQKLLSVEEIDNHIKPHLQANLAAIDFCGIYKAVRPILVFAKALLFFKPAWQAILEAFITSMDNACKG